MVPKNLIVLSFLLESCASVHFYFGECPIYYEEPCRSDLVKFVLSTSTGNVTKLYQLNPFKLYLPESFNPSVPLKILVHGYGGLEIDKAIKSVQKAYESLGYNMGDALQCQTTCLSQILVDWGPLSQLPCYATSYFNTWHVGQCLAILAVSLIPFGVHPDLLHVIGFSLGAHIAGFTGTNLRKVLKTVPGRITGLDPALPFFATLKNDWKLDSSDARFVDVVHTSAGSFGKIEAIGHADFYMNGGFFQPACRQAPYPPLCSHMMSGLYFAESIISDNSFIGVQCDNVVNFLFGFCSRNSKAAMGEFVDQRTRGSFFVDTSNSTPYALGISSYGFENFVFI